MALISTLFSKKNKNLYFYLPTCLFFTLSHTHYFFVNRLSTQQIFKAFGSYTLFTACIYNFGDDTLPSDIKIPPHRRYRNFFKIIPVHRPNEM